MRTEAHGPEAYSNSPQAHAGTVTHEPGPGLARIDCRVCGRSVLVVTG